MRIAQDLNFDMAGLGNEFLDEDTVITKGACRLILGRLEPLAGLLVIPRDAHALAAAARRGLDHHGVSDLARDFHSLIRIRDQPHISGHSRDTRLLGDFLGSDLIAHGFNRACGRANKGHACGLQRLGEFHVLGQKTIARMHSLGPAFLDGRHDLIDHDIAFIGGGRADMDRFISHFYMQRVAIGIGIDRHGLNTHLSGCLDDAAGNFAAIGDEQFLEHLGVSLFPDHNGPFRTQKTTARHDCPAMVCVQV